MIGSAIAVHRILGPHFQELTYQRALVVALRAFLLPCLSVILLCPSAIRAAFEFHPVSAQAAGMGDTGTAMAAGAEGLFWNPAAAAWAEKASAFGGHNRPFGLKEMETQALSAAGRLGRVGLGATYQGYGFALYREQVFGITIGVRVSRRAGLGLSVRSLHLTTAGQPARRWTAFDLGFRILLNDRLFAGATAWNAGGTRTRIIGQGGAFGLGMHIAPDLALLVDIQKEAGLPTGGGAGLAWEIAPALVLRTGIGGRPERLSAGAGLRQRQLAIDYAAAWHTVLGLSHRVSLSIGK